MNEGPKAQPTQLTGGGVLALAIALPMALGFYVTLFALVVAAIPVVLVATLLFIGLAKLIDWLT